MVSAPSDRMALSSVFQQFIGAYLSSLFYSHFYRLLLSLVACFFATVYHYSWVYRH